MNPDFIRGFVKQAQTKGIREDQAQLLLKAAGWPAWLLGGLGGGGALAYKNRDAIKNWASDTMTNTTDNLNIAGDSLMNNPFTHAVNAINPFSGMFDPDKARAGVAPKGFKDYFTGIGDRFSASQDFANQGMAKNYTDVMGHQLEQGNTSVANKYQQMAKERIGWIQQPQQKNELAKTFGNTLNSYNDHASSAWLAEREAAKQQVLAQSRAKSQSDALNADTDRALNGTGIFNPRTAAQENVQFKNNNFEMGPTKPAPSSLTPPPAPVPQVKVPNYGSGRAPY